MLDLPLERVKSVGTSTYLKLVFSEPLNKRAKCEARSLRLLRCTRNDLILMSLRGA